MKPTKWQACLVALLCMTANVSHAQTIRAKLGVSAPDSHPMTIGARHFAKLASEKSQGRISITVYPGGQLGSDLQQQNALRGGTQEFFVPSTATLANLDPAFGILGMPFSFQNEAHADAVLDGEFGQMLMTRLPKVDLVGLSFFENGFRHITNSRRAINSVDDIRGLKIRTIQSSLYIDLFNALGANAVPMAVTELFSALESRAVDAQENPFTIIAARKFYDVQKYLSVTGHTYDVQALVASKKFWDRLTPADQQLLREAALQTSVYQRTVSRELNGKLRAELAALGMIINDVSPDELAKMRAALQGVTTKHSAASGADVAAAFNKALQEARP